MNDDAPAPKDLACPDCGHANPAAAMSCERCNFPLAQEAPDAGATESPATPDEVASEAVAPEPRTTAPEAKVVIAVPPRLERARRKRQVKDPSLTLWLTTGLLGAIALMFIAVQGFQQNNFPRVEGARPEQQERADELRRLLESDSTNVAARIALGDILYDTANWSDAIVNYRAAVRMDSTRIEALVDLGVCYYNLGFTSDAERHFELALAKNPGQHVALFNMGILHERRGDPMTAVRFYRRALAAEPPEHMIQPLEGALERAQAATGRPPVPGGR